jgi:hypothetical protein
LTPVVFVAPPESALHAKYANWIGVKALLIYFQSFAMLMAWNDAVYHIFYTSFRWFHLFNVDFSRTFDPNGFQPQYSFWATVGSAFVPKACAFVVGAGIWFWLAYMGKKTKSHQWTEISSRVRSVLLQFAFWLSFPFFGSLVGIWGSECGGTNAAGRPVGGGEGQADPDCGGTWILPLMRGVSLVLAASIFVFIYRLWRELTLNAHWFDIAKTDHYAASVVLDLGRLGAGDDEWAVLERKRREEHRTVGQRLQRFAHFLFYPVSRLMSWFLLRLCTDLEKEAQLRAKYDNTPYDPLLQQVAANSPREKDTGSLGTSDTDSFTTNDSQRDYRTASMRSEDDTTDWDNAAASAAEDWSQVNIEDFLKSVVKKLDGQSPEKHDVRPIVTMLKGNWYTTVADLRNLNQADALKLGIPLRLFQAMQAELFPAGQKPSHSQPEANTSQNSLGSYTTLQSLTVASEPKNAFLRVYGPVADHYILSHLLFSLDELVVRGIIWCVIVVATSSTSMLQLSVMLAFQIWYCGFLLFQRPYKRREWLISDVIPNVGLAVVIACMIVVAQDNDSFVLLLIIAIVHVLVAIGALAPQILLIASREQKRRRQERRGLMRNVNETTVLLPESHNSTHFYPRESQTFDRSSFDRDGFVPTDGDEQRDASLAGGRFESLAGGRFDSADEDRS